MGKKRRKKERQVSAREENRAGLGKFFVVTILGSEEERLKLISDRDKTLVLFPSGPGHALE